MAVTDRLRNLHRVLRLSIKVEHRIVFPEPAIDDVSKNFDDECFLLMVLTSAIEPDE